MGRPAKQSFAAESGAPSPVPGVSASVWREAKAAALVEARECGGSTMKQAIIARAKRRLAGVPAVGSELNRQQRSEAARESRALQKSYSLKEEIERIRAVKRGVLDSITPEKLEKAPVSQLGVLYGILTDKERLLQGEATMIVSHQNRDSAEQMAAKLMEELDRRGIRPKLPPVVDGEFEEVTD